MNRMLIRLLCLIVWGALSLVSLRSAAAQSPISVSLGAATPPIVRHDFGEVEQGTSQPLTYTFLLRNASASPITISRFQPSCHCTSAALAPDQALPYILAPGAQAAIQVSVVVEPYLTGQIEKSVAVLSDGQDAPLATLTLDADLHPLVVMDPMSLDLGAVAAGRSRSEIVTATVDERLLSGSAPPILAGSDPDLHILPMSGSATGPSSQQKTFRYRVTLSSQAALGPVQDLLQFRVPAQAPKLNGMTLADAPGVPVTGEVKGSAAIMPETLAFGIVTQGRPAPLSVRLTALQPGRLQSVQAHAADRFVQLHWGKMTGRTRTLQVMLTASAPQGAVRSQVLIRLADGSQFRLPLTAYVVSR